MRNGIAIIIASTRRPVELGRWIDHVNRQSLKPLEMIWVVTSSLDLPKQFQKNHADWSAEFPWLKIVDSPIGLTTQRNRGLAALQSNPAYIAFFDDDYIPTRTCLADIIRCFEALPSAGGLTGTLLADGIKTPGINYEAARALIEAHENQVLNETKNDHPSLEHWDGLYGCNMAYRSEVIEGVQFDENLPLYGWQEDVDFAVRTRGHWDIGRTDGFIGLHQGVKGGRTSGKKFGYSQIANPHYLVRKGSMKWRKGFVMASRNIIANHARCLKPEHWIDRRGRVVGNWLAIYDLIRGRVHPMRILEL